MSADAPSRSSFLLRGARLFTPEHRPDAHAVAVSDGRIDAIGGNDLSEFGDRIVDLEGLIVAPGFVDLQINGSFGCDVMSADVETLRRLAAELPRRGCTAFVPTVVTAERGRLIQALHAIAEASRVPVRGARIVGAHLEGPYISPRHPGAHDLGQIRPFDRDEWDALRAAAGGMIRIVTLAPEAPANQDAIPVLTAQGVVVAAGHTDATYDDMRSAVRAGLRLVTHVGNAMRGFHHREPGVLGAVLDCEGLIPSVIPDGVHVHPVMLRLLARLKGATRVIAITDAAWMAGLPAGSYRWEGREVHYDGTSPRLGDGRLAGSGLTTDAAVAGLVRLAGIDLSHAITMAARTPSRLIGGEPLGELAPSGPADIVVLDAELRVRATFVAGELVFVAPDAPDSLLSLAKDNPLSS